MPDTIEFVVHGQPATKGSTFAFRSHSTGRIITKSDCKFLVRWSRDVAAAATIAQVPHAPKGIGVRITAIFELQRPRTRSRRRPSPVTRPDVDKLQRALLDALIGVAFDDDAQVLDLHAFKIYGDRPLTRVAITPIPDVSW